MGIKLRPVIECESDNTCHRGVMHPNGVKELIEFAEGMGWELVDGKWICPVCLGHCTANEFRDQVKSQADTATKRDQRRKK